MSKIQRSIAQQDATAILLKTVRAEAAALSFPLEKVIGCTGVPIVRTQAAWGIGCLLDLDASVMWGCQPTVLSHRNRHHGPDSPGSAYFGETVVDAVASERPRSTRLAKLAAEKLRCVYDLCEDVRSIGPATSSKIPTSAPDSATAFSSSEESRVLADAKGFKRQISSNPRSEQFE